MMAIREMAHKEKCVASFPSASRGPYSKRNEVSQKGRGTKAELGLAVEMDGYGSVDGLPDYGHPPRRTFVVDL